MSIWKTVSIEAARVCGIHGRFVVVELAKAQHGTTVCIEDPAFVSESFELRQGDFVEVHTRVSNLVSHRMSYAVEQCDPHEARHLATGWNFRVLYGDTQ